jgi:hypothetical protein
MGIFLKTYEYGTRAMAHGLRTQRRIVCMDLGVRSARGRGN